MSYPATEPTTLTELFQARYDALHAALAMYRRAMAAHPNNPHRLEWLHAQRYWTTKAYQYHGEIKIARVQRCPKCPTCASNDVREIVTGSRLCREYHCRACNDWFLVELG